MPSKPRTLAGILCPRRQTDRAYNRFQRDPAVARVHGSARWQAVRARVLRDEPLCRACAQAGRSELATQVDHVVPLAVDLDRAFDPTNLQPLCTPCHAAKSAAVRKEGLPANLSGEGGTSSSRGKEPPSGAGGASLFSRDRSLGAPPIPHGFRPPDGSGRRS